MDAALQELQQVTQRVFNEVARFRQEQRVALKHVMTDFIRMQIAHAKTMQTAWESILPEVQAMPFDETS